MQNEMQWVNALSTRPSLEAAVSEVVEQAHALLRAPADLAIVFISAAFTSDYSRLMPLLGERLDVPTLIGCSGGGIVGCSETGVAHEIENGPVLSLMLATLPNVDVQAFHLNSNTLPDLDSPPDAWVEQIGVSPQNNPDFILLGDGNSFRVNDCLQGLDYAYPGALKVGGLASAGAFNSGNALFCNYRYYTQGLVGVALSGAIKVETIVAQGCRPVGPLFQIADGERNLLLGLDCVEDDRGAFGGSSSTQRTPLEMLQQVFQSLSEPDRSLAQHSLFIGIARDEFKLTLEPGDFLIRNILGVDPRSGAIAMGDRVRPGQRIRFHLRDAQTSAEDLQFILNRFTKPGLYPMPLASGALMFSCLGRGEGLYGKPDFDSHLFQQSFPQIPLAGFFCNGEIGPVAGNTFLHGYTSVFGIFCQP